MFQTTLYAETDLVRVLYTTFLVVVIVITILNSFRYTNLRPHPHIFSSLNFGNFLT